MKHYVFAFALACCISLFAAAPASSDTSAPHKIGKQVEILVTSWCAYCKRLENYLRTRNIPFTRYDIEKDPRGEAIYHQLGGGGVPITRIGSQIIRGFDEREFDKLFTQKPPSPNKT